MEVTGKLIAAMPTQSGVSQRSGNSWMSREYVIEVPGQYPKKCCFKVFGEDRLKQFNLRKDETVTVQFDIDAHEYNGRWFNEIQAYNIIRPQQQAAPAPQPQSQAAAPAPQSKVVMVAVPMIYRSDLSKPCHYRHGFFIMSIAEERHTLKALYPTTSNKELSQMLGISVELVSKRARILGLRKDPKYLSAVNRKCGLHSPVSKNWKCK